MKRTLKILLLLLAVGTLFAGLAAAQTRSFDEPGVEFTFEIPDERWKVISKAPANIVFGTAREGDLEVRKLTVPTTKDLIDVMKEEEVKLQFLQGFVAGKEERFSGTFPESKIYNFEFLRSGRPMAGRFYFLRSGETVYVLRFTAYTTNLRSLRTDTDIMARTFKLKKA